GRTVTIPTLHLVRVRGGRIIEMWGLADVDAAQAELARGR
ncbi:MAG: hypothetical protein QOD86_3025, partial [Miltoncostaeaceae bacterium]|nr:hypothetical protein [Miltoncostaeaceae bacterium]